MDQQGIPAHEPCPGKGRIMALIQRNSIRIAPETISGKMFPQQSRCSS
jgi:hypothetical protein